MCHHSLPGSLSKVILNCTFGDSPIHAIPASATRGSPSRTQRFPPGVLPTALLAFIAPQDLTLRLLADDWIVSRSVPFLPATHRVGSPIMRPSWAFMSADRPPSSLTTPRHSILRPRSNATLSFPKPLCVRNHVPSTPNPTTAVVLGTTLKYTEDHRYCLSSRRTKDDYRLSANVPYTHFHPAQNLATQTHQHLSKTTFG